MSLFANNEPHNHEDRKDFGLDPQLKLIIADHFSKGISKPNQILKVLRNEGHGEIEKSKLVNFLARLKKQKYGSAPFNYGEFENWCEIHSTMPDAEDESYVVGHEVNCDADNDEDRVLRAFISTKRLITLAIHQKLICSDATYKLLWHGFPVLLVGGVDKDKEFHPYGISITKSEAAEDFEFIFRTLKSEVEKIGGTNFDPNILVADSADAITSGFGQAFGNIFQRVNCWSHVARKVDQRLSLIADEATRKEIREDIEILQLVRSEAAFLKASELWRRKWSSPDVATFTDYFFSNWIQENNGWFEGRAPGYPSTNNALEATNNVIKNEGTFRERLPIAQFVTLAMATVADW